jgi:DNA processing protein
MFMSTINQEERAYRAALYEVDGIGPARMQVLLNFFGSAKGVWNAKKSKLVKIGLSEDTVDELRKHKKRIDPKQHLIALAKLGIKVVLLEDKEYPELLREIDNSPSLLLVSGHFDASDERALAVVGTRKPTP